jgi:hypothetical protein
MNTDAMIGKPFADKGRPGEGLLLDEGLRSQTFGIGPTDSCLDGDKRHVEAEALCSPNRVSEAPLPGKQAAARRTDRKHRLDGLCCWISASPTWTAWKLPEDCASEPTKLSRRFYAGQAC